VSFILLKKGEIYSPEYKGNMDTLIANDKIVLIDKNISESVGKLLDKKVKIIDTSNCLIIPGFIDQHIHIDGAGGD